MQPPRQIKEITRFIADYASMLLGSGVHCSRVIRNTRRIASGYGLNLNMSVFAASIILTLSDKDENEMYTEVVRIPEVPVSFQLNSELSALSWKVYDNPGMDLGELEREYRQIISRPRLRSWMVALVVSLANACFCYLLGGNFLSMPIVFGATWLGYNMLRFLKKRGMDHFIAVLAVSFVSSALASLAVFVPGATAEVAVAASVLFMIPGVPMITGVIDLIEGHTLMGFARIMRAFLIVVCLAVGLSVSMVIFEKGLLFGGEMAGSGNLLNETVVRGLFAAVAACGFGAVSCPSVKSFFPIAVLAALGYALRYVLMQAAGFDIATSTLLAGLFIGFLSLPLGAWVKCPMTTLYIPALLPFVPGMYAYRAVFNIILFMQNVREPMLAMPHLNDFFFNTIITCTVIITMTVGASMPMFIFSRTAKSLTRHSDLHSHARFYIHGDVMRLWHRKK